METTQPRKIYSISQLNKASKSLLEKEFGIIWVEGEISNFSVPSSGHWYFTLKDEKAQISCAMFKNKNRFIQTPNDGDKVLIRTRVSLFEARGNYQLILEYLEPAGLGQLQRQYEQLKLRLEQEGLFLAQHKKNLPEVIHHIGLITSETGAAIHDFLSIVSRRYPLMEVTLYPVMVQGDEAHVSIIDALNRASENPELDVIVLTRGGGSLEDLWCFNNEQLSRAIYQSEIPVVSAIGHEVDFTITDFVADLRAPTPSAAAELLTPDQIQIQETLCYLRNQLLQNMSLRLQQLQQKIDWLQSRLKSPSQQLHFHENSLIHLSNRLRSRMKSILEEKNFSLQRQKMRLKNINPQTEIETNKIHLRQLHSRLLDLMKNQMQQKQMILKTQMQQLSTLNPMATLERGFAIAKDEKGQVIASKNQVHPGDNIITEMAKFTIESEVTKIQDKVTK